MLKGADPAMLAVADALPAGDQPQDCQGTRPYRATNSAHARRRRDRIGELMFAIDEQRTLISVLQCSKMIA